MYLRGTMHWISKERAEKMAGEHVDLYKNDMAVVRKQPDPDADCFEVWFLGPKPTQPGQAEFIFTVDDIIFGDN